MVTCAYPGCFAPADPPSGRGRPPIYCASHRGKASSKRAVRFQRLLQCCADAKHANPRARRCPQHKAWAKFTYQAKVSRGTAHDLNLYTRMLDQYDYDGEEGEKRQPAFRITTNDSYLIESAKDRRDGKRANDFIAANGKTQDVGEDSPPSLEPTNEAH